MPTNRLVQTRQPRVSALLPPEPELGCVWTRGRGGCKPLQLQTALQQALFCPQTVRPQTPPPPILTDFHRAPYAALCTAGTRDPLNSDCVSHAEQSWIRPGFDQPARPDPAHGPHTQPTAAPCPQHVGRCSPRPGPALGRLVWCASQPHSPEEAKPLALQVTGARKGV